MPWSWVRPPPSCPTSLRHPSFAGLPRRRPHASSGARACSLKHAGAYAAPQCAAEIRSASERSRRTATAALGLVEAQRRASRLAKTQAGRDVVNAKRRTRRVGGGGRLEARPLAAVANRPVGIMPFTRRPGKSRTRSAGSRKRHYGKAHERPRSCGPDLAAGPWGARHPAAKRHRRGAGGGMSWPGQGQPFYH